MLKVCVLIFQITNDLKAGIRITNHSQITTTHNFYNPKRRVAHREAKNTSLATERQSVQLSTKMKPQSAHPCNCQQK